MLSWYLFALGLVFCIMGWNKQTGLAKGFRESAATFFFVYGFFHLIIGLMLFNAAAPYGSIESINKTTFYSAGYQEIHNDTITCIDCNPVVNASCCEHDFNITYSGQRTDSYQNVYSEGGKEIVNMLFILDMILGAGYVFLYCLGWLKMVVESLTRKRPRDGEET